MTHLVDTATGLPDVPSEQLNVVDLTGARCSLIALVDSLKRGSQDRLASPNDLDGLFQELRCDSRDLVHLFRGVTLDDTLQLFDADGVLLDVFLVDVSPLKHFSLHTVEERQVGSRSGLQVDGGKIGSGGPPRVDDDASRRLRAMQAVKHTGPKDGLCCGNVVTDDEQAVGDVDIGVRPGLTVTSEGFSLR